MKKPSVDRSANPPAGPPADSAAPSEPDAPPAPSKTPDRRSADNTGRSPHAPGAEPGRNDTDMPLPHERDQSSEGSTEREPDPRIRQAHEDLESGQVDTDLRNTPGLDAQRRRKLVDEKPKP